MPLDFHCLANDSLEKQVTRLTAGSSHGKCQQVLSILYLRNVTDEDEFFKLLFRRNKLVLIILCDSRFGTFYLDGEQCFYELR